MNTEAKEHNIVGIETLGTGRDEMYNEYCWLKAFESYISEDSKNLEATHSPRIRARDDASEHLDEKGSARR